ncbi:glutathione synthase [Microbulbifer sp. GL-2]|uniref:glutathione synthase n=1 Tax=Microbulbifer sp. GL-2 TaxID=2591606 RepID=UPI00116241A5|nr:glutathione synthase [Microbulbifer sp. GL-2]BBM01052.1 glutathione synthetase [Microbulbifer sp. GL-2]
MNYSLGVVMDPIAQINFKKDTTLALLQAAQDSGFQLFYFEQTDLYLDNGRAVGRAQPLKVFDDAEHWFSLDDPREMLLGELDTILMRVDPPFDNEYIYSTYILEAAEREGSLVVNNPQSLRDCNEKIFATTFPQCCPPVLVSRDMRRLREFHKTHQDVIFKPLDGMGGAGIFHCKPDGANLGAILEMLTGHGRQQIMAQRYIPEIKDGDKRILVVDGEAVPYCLARIPEAGETRGNLAAGGRGEARPLTDHDRWIVEQVAPTLKEKGLLFVGLDVIGEYLTEINVTSPTCVREIDAAYNTDIGARLMSAITHRLAQKS